jgi:hypothetical protein
VVIESPVMIETSAVIEVATCPAEVRTSDDTAGTLPNHICAAKSANDAPTAFAYMPATESASHIAAAAESASRMPATSEPAAATESASHMTAAAETASHVAAATTTSHVAAAAATALVRKRHSAGQGHACGQYNHDLAQHCIYSFGRSRPFDQTKPTTVRLHGESRSMASTVRNRSMILTLYVNYHRSDHPGMHAQMLMSAATAMVPKSTHGIIPA